MARKKAVKKVNKKAGEASKGSKVRGGETRHKPAAKADTPSPAADADVSTSPILDRPIPKTKHTHVELLEFRQLLLAKRAELVGDVNHMTSEALRDNRPGGAGNLSNVPLHMADIGSDNWEQEFTLGLVAGERQLLREIDAALARIEDRTYGICEATHKPISEQRLRAQPWARYCIEYARLKEQGGSA